HRRTDLQSLDRLHEAGGDLVVEGSRDEQPRPRMADLPLVHVHGPDRTRDGDLEVGVVEEDVRRLAGELERDLLHGPARALPDPAPDLRGPGEGDLVDA